MHSASRCGRVNRALGAVAMTVKPPPRPLALALRDVLGDWWEEWKERSAILEIDGGLPRREAEVAAMGEILRKRQRDTRERC